MNADLTITCTPEGDPVRSKIRASVDEHFDASQLIAAELIRLAVQRPGPCRDHVTFYKQVDGVERGFFHEVLTEMIDTYITSFLCLVYGVRPVDDNMPWRMGRRDYEPERLRKMLERDRGKVFVTSVIGHDFYETLPADQIIGSSDPDGEFGRLHTEKMLTSIDLTDAGGRSLGEGERPDC